MSITIVIVAAIIAGVVGIIARGRWRLPLLLVVSTLAVYALQPNLPVRYLDFWLPTLTLALAVLSWVLTTPRQLRSWKANWPAAAILIGVSLAVGLTRYLDISLPFPASRPPPVLSLLVLMAVVLLLALLLARFTIPGPAALKTAIVLLIVALAAVKDSLRCSADQHLAAFPERTVHGGGRCAGFPLAGFFIHRLSSAAHVI